MRWGAPLSRGDGAKAAAADALPVAICRWGMHILVIGGTRFLGRALVDAALGHGHSVTLFNRAKTNPGLYPGLELIRGDRRTDADRLSGRTFDAVADVAGMQ